MAGMGLPYWRCWAAETLSDSRFQSWDVAERGAFWTLLNIQWREGAIPGDLTTLAKLLKLDGGAMRSLWSAIGDRFIPHPDHPGMLANPRMEEEREEAIASINQKKNAGRKGAESRWSKAKREHSAAIAAPPPSNAVPVADDSDQSKVTENKVPHRAPRLVSPFAAGADPHPNTTAVLAALYERGIDASPPSDKQAGRVEAAIAAAGIPAAVERLVVSLSSRPERPLTYHVDAIRGAARVTGNVGDLGAEIVPWYTRLTDDEVRAYREERRTIAPDLDDAPVGILGPERELAVLNDRWRSRVEERA